MPRPSNHVMDALTPRILKALEATRKSSEVTVEISIQIRDDSNNAKISESDNQEILVDLSSGIRRSTKSVSAKTDPSTIVDAVKTIVEDRLFSGRITGTAELKLCFKGGNFTKFEKFENQRSVFAQAAMQKGKISDWVNT